MGKKVWIVRHSMRVDGGTQPESDCSITFEGNQLAIKTGMILLSKIKNLDRVLVSPFKRTIETSYSILSQFPNTPIEVCSELAETLTVQHQNYLNVKLPASLLAYLNSHKITCPESDQHITERCQNLLNRLATDNFENIIIISHAGLINRLVSIMDFQIKYTPSYCNYITFEWIDDRWKMIDLNQSK